MRDKTTASCDHGAAVMFGIPYVFITDFFEGRPNFHTPDDKLEYVDMGKLEGYLRSVLFQTI